MSKEENISERIEHLINKVNSNTQKALDDTIQNELGRLITLLPDIERAIDSHLIGAIEVAVSALLSEQPNVKLATMIRKDIEQRVRVSPIKSLFKKISHSNSPLTFVILGLGSLFYFVPILILYLPKIAGLKEIFGINVSILLLVGLAGAFGSIVSIMVRIQDFTPFTNIDPSVLFFTGFFKPVVGASFALFIFAVLRAGLIPVIIEPDKEMYFLFALSFVSGFSERFAKDIATKTEQKIEMV